MIIAASIFAGLSLAVSSLIVDMRKSTSYLEGQLEKIQLLRNFETILKDGMACQQTLQGITIPQARAANVLSLKSNSGAPVYHSDSISGKLRIGQITVKNDTLPGPDSSGFVDVEIPIFRNQSGGGPQALKPLEIKINVTVDAARVVTSCSSTAIGTTFEVCGTPGVYPARTGWVQCPDPAKTIDLYCVTRVAQWGTGRAKLNANSNHVFNNYDSSVPRLRCVSTTMARACARCFN